MKKRRRVAFTSIAAQADNLGDIVIRQSAMDILSSAGRDQLAYTGSMPRSYIDAFDLPSGVSLETSRRRYITRLVRCLLRGEADLVFAPGPFMISGVAGTLKAAVMLVLVCSVRLGGGEVFAIGRAIRGTGRLGRLVQRATIKASSLYVVRDRVSANTVGRSIQQAPDLALLGVHPAEVKERPIVVMSFRVDSVLDRAQLARVVETAIDAGRTPLLVTQVQRDDVLHRELARSLGIECLEWRPETSHREQLTRVRAAYAQAGVVLTNRLHVALLAATGGAVIADAGVVSMTKIEETVGGRLPIVRYPDCFTDQIGLQDAMFKATQSALAACALDLVKLEHMVQRTVSDSNRNPSEG